MLLPATALVYPEKNKFTTVGGYLYRHHKISTVFTATSLQNCSCV